MAYKYLCIGESVCYLFLYNFFFFFFFDSAHVSIQSRSPRKAYGTRISKRLVMSMGSPFACVSHARAFVAHISELFPPAV